MPNHPAKTDRTLALIVLLNGVRIGRVSQTRVGTFRFTYDESWRNDERAYPLSLSLPLSAREHGAKETTAFLWGLLPDNPQTLERYGRRFAVSAGNPVALLSHLGRDCAGAVQFAPLSSVAELEGRPASGPVRWLREGEVAQELRSIRETGLPANATATSGQFSLAGAQPKIALLQQSGRWGQPLGRMPSNRILKPPSSGTLHGFVENEHFCLELANSLQLGTALSRVVRFEDEIAISVERFDRIKQDRSFIRIHQEDVCQARAILPSRKYENEGGPGIDDVISLLRDSSLDSQDDIERFLRVTALNWVIAATDGHAKNYALLHQAGGVRLAPFYDILSYLPYADESLHGVKLAMSIGGEYAVRRVNRTRWERLAASNRLARDYVLDNVQWVLARIPTALRTVSQSAIESDLDPKIVQTLSKRIHVRTRDCEKMLSAR